MFDEHKDKFHVGPGTILDGDSHESERIVTHTILSDSLVLPVGGFLGVSNPGLSRPEGVPLLNLSSVVNNTLS